MKLFEILTGDNPRVAKKSDSFWVLYNVPKINFYPQVSDSIYHDVFSFIAKVPYTDDMEESPAIKAAHTKAYKILHSSVDYSNVNSHGWFLVSNGTVNFDIGKYTSTMSRRLDRKIFDTRNRENAAVYPILGGELTFNRVVDMVKALKALVKVKPTCASYRVEGDVRVDGKTVQEVIDGAATEFDHRTAFKTNNSPMTLFHGTSAKRAQEILKSGLKPGKRSGIYSDMIPGYSENNIYLALNPADAANYATREAINDDSNAVILAVKVAPILIQKFSADEDSMHWFKYLPEIYKKKFIKDHPIISEIWPDGFDAHIKNIDHKGKRFGLEWLFDRHNEFGENAQKVLKKYGITQANIIDTEKALFIDLFKTFLAASASTSLKKNSTVALAASIPASEISIVRTWSLKGSKIKGDADSAAYRRAMEIQKKSMK